MRVFSNTELPEEKTNSSSPLPIWIKVKDFEPVPLGKVTLLRFKKNKENKYAYDLLTSQSFKELLEQWGKCYYTLDAYAQGLEYLFS